MTVIFISTVKAMTAKATTLTVPDEAIAALGQGKKPRVIVTLNGYSYRAMSSRMGGESLIPLSAIHREAAGVKAGDQVEVTIELDTEPHDIVVPDDLSSALANVVGAREIFDTLTPAKRQSLIQKVNDAKTEATRERRISAILARLHV
jgi:hypothetical protein